MKTCRLHILLIFLLTVIAHVCNAQTDEIVTLKDEVILCHITREDSTRVFFKIGGNAGSVEASLLRTEIKAIRYAPPQDIPSPSINPSHIVKEKETAPVTSQNNTLHVTLPAHAKQNSRALPSWRRLIWLAPLGGVEQFDGPGPPRASRPCGH